MGLKFVFNPITGNLDLINSSEGGSQTPWTSDIDGGGYSLSNVLLAQAKNFIDGYTTTATAGGTTTLLATSNRQQFFTGTLVQTVLLPVASTMVLGQSFEIVNNSSNVLVINTSAGSTVVNSLPAGQSAIITCILASGTTAASWNAYTTSAFQPAGSYLKTDQSSPQTLSGGAFAGSGLLKITTGLLGVDTTAYQPALSFPISIANGGTNATGFNGGNTIPFFDGTRFIDDSTKFYYDATTDNSQLHLGNTSSFISGGVIIGQSSNIGVGGGFLRMGGYGNGADIARIEYYTYDVSIVKGYQTFHDGSGGEGFYWFAGDPAGSNSQMAYLDTVLDVGTLNLAGGLNTNGKINTNGGGVDPMYLELDENITEEKMLAKMKEDNAIKHIGSFWLYYDAVKKTLAGLMPTSNKTLKRFIIPTTDDGDIDFDLTPPPKKVIPQMSSKEKLARRNALILKK